MLFTNLVPLWNFTSFPFCLKLIATVILSVNFLLLPFRPLKHKSGNKRLDTLKKGSSLLKITGILSFAESIFIVLFILLSSAETPVKIFSVLMPVVTAVLMLFISMTMILACSRQSKLKDYTKLFLLWWLPFGNIFIFRKFYKNSVKEYVFESEKAELENSRKESEICSTKYPVLMVHGIFFRDWQLFGYWGRIPASLEKNGARVFYANQQSAQSIENSAEEIKESILKIVRETGAEKVNIIAHSKGGLDSRYAVSRLGMDKYVATLTTVNTPHKGCDMVDFLLAKLPEKTVNSIEKRYNSIFSALGDKSPDFISGVKDLSAEKAKSYDEKMPDSPDVSYRSFMSVMKKACSAGFPLNIGYMLIKRLNGANDGLVWERSAEHGQYKLIDAPDVRGISHGDVIDLFRENIDGYDVREFYVRIVSELKNQGY